MPNFIIISGPLWLSLRMASINYNDTLIIYILNLCLHTGMPENHIYCSSNGRSLIAVLVRVTNLSFSKLWCSSTNDLEVICNHYHTQLVSSQFMCHHPTCKYRGFVYILVIWTLYSIHWIASAWRVELWGCLTPSMSLT